MKGNKTRCNVALVLPPFEILVLDFAGEARNEVVLESFWFYEAFLFGVESGAKCMLYTGTSLRNTPNITPSKNTYRG